MRTFISFLFSVIFILPLIAGGDEGDSTATNNDLPHFSTFSTTRIVNGHSFETHRARTLDFRITHRFGDIGGDNGGNHTLWGLDNSSDIRIAFEYALTDDLMIGAGRSKGGGAWREVWDGFGKYVVLRQSQDHKMPLSVGVLGSGIVTGMVSSTDSSDVTFFAESSHRLAYTAQLFLARKFGERLSIQLTPSYSHRNYVASDDVNDMLSMGASLRFKISKVIALNIEYFYNFEQDRTINGLKVYDPLGFSLEFDVGGHVFQIDLVNSAAIGENQFIPYTTSNWADGEYRLGFTISRPFKL